MLDRVELKSCPFCGGEALMPSQIKRKPTTEEYTVHCDSCDMGLTVWLPKCLAVQAWNTRHGDTP